MTATEHFTRDQGVGMVLGIQGCTFCPTALKRAANTFERNSSMVRKPLPTNICCLNVSLQM